MATTYNKTGTTLVSGVPSVSDRGAYMSGSDIYVMRNSVDLTGMALVDNDLFQCLAIPADTVVLNVYLKIITAAVGTTCTMDIGIGGTGTEWDDGLDGKATAGTVTGSIVGTDGGTNATYGAGGGTLYTTADTIDVYMEAITSITAGPKFEIYAVCINLNFKSTV